MLSSQEINEFLNPAIVFKCVSPLNFYWPQINGIALPPQSALLAPHIRPLIRQFCIHLRPTCTQSVFGEIDQSFYVIGLVTHKNLFFEAN